MVKVDFPTSKDVYLEVNGNKVAVVEGYKVHSTRESHYVEAFGESEPIATVGGRIKHFIEITRVYACNNNITNFVDFYNLTNFNFVIVLPDKRIIYSGCEWADLSQTAKINDTILESVTLIASKRLEMA